MIANIKELKILDQIDASDNSKSYFSTNLNRYKPVKKDTRLILV